MDQERLEYLLTIERCYKEMDEAFWKLLDMNYRMFKSWEEGKIDPVLEVLDGEMHSFLHTWHEAYQGKDRS